jgi:hypothetical protein
MRRELERQFADRPISFSDDAKARFRFNNFLHNRYRWCVSGIDWPETGHVERVDANHDFARHISGLIQRHPDMFSERLCVFFFDATHDIVAEADRDDLLAVVKFVEAWDDVFVNEFWVFDEAMGTCVEAYHEGYITLSAPFLADK